MIVSLLNLLSAFSSSPQILLLVSNYFDSEGSCLFCCSPCKQQKFLVPRPSTELVEHFSLLAWGSSSGPYLSSKERFGWLQCLQGMPWGLEQHRLSRLRLFCITLQNLYWMLSAKQGNMHFTTNVAKLLSAWNGHVSQTLERENGTNRINTMLVKVNALFIGYFHHLQRISERTVQDTEEKLGIMFGCKINTFPVRYGS